MSLIYILFYDTGATTVSFPAVHYAYCRYVYGASYACTGSEQSLFACQSNSYASSTVYTNSYGVRCVSGKLIKPCKQLCCKIQIHYENTCLKIKISSNQ